VFVSQISVEAPWARRSTTLTGRAEVNFCTLDFGLIVPVRRACLA
jgi:hypothetical protein